MKLATAEQRAEDVKGPKSAARLYNDIEAELALGAGGSEEDYEQGERALGILRARYPDVEAQAHGITEPPALSHRAKDNAYGGHEGRQRRSTPHAPKQPRAPRAPAPRSSSSHPARRASSAASSAASWAGDTSWGSLFGWMFMAGMGLSVFYLLLTHNKSVSELALGATNITRAVISPHVDPLNPGRSL